MNCVFICVCVFCNLMEFCFDGIVDNLCVFFVVG